MNFEKHSHEEGAEYVEDYSVINDPYDTLGLDTAILQLERLIMELDGEDFYMQETSKYELFRPRMVREHLFNCFRNMSEYIRREKIADLLFLDRSARVAYLGIKTYLRERYPDEPQPGTYFVNPRGFSLDYFEESPASLRMPFFSTDKTRLSRIDKRFSKVYEKLMEDKEKPVMVFDSCIHRGNTIRPVLESMERLKFKNIKVGVYSKDTTLWGNNDIKIDFVMTREPLVNQCVPFRVDSLLMKNSDVVSQVDQKNVDYEKAARMRNEVVQFVTDGVNQLANEEKGEDM